MLYNIIGPEMTQHLPDSDATFWTIILSCLLLWGGWNHYLYAGFSKKARFWGPPQKQERTLLVSTIALTENMKTDICCISAVFFSKFCFWGFVLLIKNKRKENNHWNSHTHKHKHEPDNYIQPSKCVLCFSDIRQHMRRENLMKQETKHNLRSKSTNQIWKQKHFNQHYTNHTLWLQGRQCSCSQAETKTTTRTHQIKNKQTKTTPQNKKETRKC